LSAGSRFFTVGRHPFPVVFPVAYDRDRKGREELSMEIKEQNRARPGKGETVRMRSVSAFARVVSDKNYYVKSGRKIEGKGK
jgi:hypothetical protein